MDTDADKNGRRSPKIQNERNKKEKQQGNSRKLNSDTKTEDRVWRHGEQIWKTHGPGRQVQDRRRHRMNNRVINEKVKEETQALIHKG